VVVNVVRPSGGIDTLPAAVFDIAIDD
jgi:hypothetical protein